MPIDKQTLSKLKKFADVFRAARDRNADESNTVMFLIKLMRTLVNLFSRSTV